MWFLSRRNTALSENIRSIQISLPQKENHVRFDPMTYTKRKLIYPIDSPHMM